MAIQPADQKQALVPHVHGQLHEFATPMKIAAGMGHSLFLVTKMDDNELADESDRIINTTVMGFGANRHNPLALPHEHASSNSQKAFEQSHGDVGKAPWQLHTIEPTDAVFGENDPVESRKMRREEAIRRKKKGHETDADTLPVKKHDRHKQDHFNKNYRIEAFEVSCGSNHSMVLEKKKHLDGDTLTESRLWSFGMVAHGRLGRGKPPHFQAADADEDTDVESDVEAPEEVFEDGKVETFRAHGMNPNDHPVVQRVCCGADHTLAIVNFMGKSGHSITVHGRVFAWGLGSYGALGTRKKEDSWIPKEVWFPGESLLDNNRNVSVSQVVCGSKHSMALSHEGKVYTWGHAGNGRLGLGRSETRLGQSFSAQFEPQPLQRLSDTRIVFLAAGESHSGCCDQLGGMHTWGEGSFGRCGHGMNMDSVYPARVETLLGTAINKIAMGMAHTLAVSVKGQLYSWGKGPATGLDKGDNEYESTPLPVNLEGNFNNPVYQVACGHLHSMVLLKDGTIFTFGNGSDYRLPRFGRDLGRDDVGYPLKMEIKGWSKTMVDSSLELAAGNATTKGKREKHQKMPAIAAAGGSNSAVVLCNGELWIWGSHVLASKTDPAPENRDEDDAPKNVETSTKDVDIWIPQLLRKGFRAPVRTVSIGHEHALALTQEQMLFAWGKGESGQLGTGNLGTFDEPQLITNVSEVICCSAGDQHSACIIEGGESYTWGKAQGGRLGLSATMNEGVQMLPEQVVINAIGTKDLRLKSLHCGTEHTCFVSEDNRVLSCGVGWFGRLGQGSQDNSYSPQFVSSSTLRADEVQCAAYHTCIVDTDKRLWLTGRDTCCCQPAGSHLVEPMLFQPFDAPMKRYIYSMSCSGAHTFVITSKKPNTHHGTELWAWGKNDKGQLGISEVQAPRIDLPWQLRLPGEGVDWHKFTNVATSSWHAMVVVEGKGKFESHFKIYSWGFCGSGRLGLKLTEADANSTEIKVADGHHLVRPPGVVDVRWDPKDQGSSFTAMTTQGDSQNTSFADLVQDPSRTWYDVQRKLHQEDPENKYEKLIEQSEKVGKQYMDYMKDVLSLWSKPSADSNRKTEYHLRRKRMEVESQYIRTLGVLSMKNSTHAPRIESMGKTEQEIKSKLYLFEELFWILQQQPLYFTNLSAQIGSKKRDEMECIVFHRVIHQLFLDFTMSRTRTLFKALVRAIMKREMQKASIAEEVFNPITSRTVPLFRQMVTNPYYMHSLAKKILDPEDKNSLMHTIVHYTLTKDGHTRRNKEAWISGMFAVCVGEYENADQYYRALRGDGKRSDEERGKGRQYFQDELKDFAKLVNGLGGKDVPYDKDVDVDVDAMEDDQLMERFAGVALISKAAWFRMRKERRVDDRRDKEETLWKRAMRLLHGPDWENQLRAQLNIDAPFINEFVTHFVKHIVGERNKEGGGENRNADFQMLLQFMFKHLTMQSYVIQFKRTVGNEWLPELLECMASIVLGSMIGGVLFAVQEGPFTMWRMKIKKYVQDLEAELIGDVGKDVLEIERDPGLLERVWWNVEHLALFFERCVHEQVDEYHIKERIKKDKEMNKDKGKEKSEEGAQRLHEDAVAKQTALELKRSTCKVLLSVFQNSESARLFMKDETETELTIDLYMSHYNMRKSTVTIGTSDMLQLTNILHANMSADSRNDNSGVAIDTEEDCRLWRIVNKILPTETVEGQKKPRTVPWSYGHIAIAQEVGEMHNFTMRARFLEFKNAGMDEPTFCKETQVPIPRSLSTQEQKKNLGKVRVVKPLRNSPGLEIIAPNGEKVYPFQELLDLFEELSGNQRGENFNPKVKYMLSAKATFSDLTFSLNDVQDEINKEMQNGQGNASILAARLQQLEHAKVYITKIHEQKDEKDLLSYMDEEIKKRFEYNEYLRSLNHGVSKIQKAQNLYKIQLEEVYRRLCQANEKTETCEMPEEITGAMQMNQERAKFIDARQQKIRMKKDRSNPSRNVLDELVRTATKDGSKIDMEKLKEMVGFPARQFKKNALEKKGVLVQLNEAIPNNVRKQMMFSFHYDNEAYTVRVFVKTTLLREFYISREDLQLLDNGLKNAVKSYGDEFLWLNCFRLRRLLAFIHAEGGL